MNKDMGFRVCCKCQQLTDASSPVCDVCGFKKCKACRKGVKWIEKPCSSRCTDCIKARKAELAWYKRND